MAPEVEHRAIVVAMINAAIGRGGRRADVASQARGPAFERMDKDLEAPGHGAVRRECDKCEVELGLRRSDSGAFTDGVEELVPLLPLWDAAESPRRNRRRYSCELLEVIPSPRHIRAHRPALTSFK